MSLVDVCRMQGLEVVSDVDVNFFAFKAFYSATGSYKKSACVVAVLLPGFKVGFKFPVFYAKINAAYDAVDGGKTYVESCVSEGAPCFVNELDEICFARFERGQLIEGKTPPLKVVGFRLRATFSFALSPGVKDFVRCIKDVHSTYGSNGVRVKQAMAGEVCVFIVKSLFKSKSSAENACREIRNCMPSGNCQKRVTYKIKTVNK